MDVAATPTPEPVFLRRNVTYCAGVDLGQSVDRTAICVIEHARGVHDFGTPYERHCGLSRRKQRPAEFYDVRYLERLPLGLSYPSIVTCVRSVIERPPLEDADLIIDETGVGRAVGDIFVAEGLAPKCVTITAGTEVTNAGRDRWHVPKGTLISGVDAALHVGKLRFAASLSEADTMKAELQDFRRSLSATGRAAYNARTGAHDDLVLAVALAVWWLQRPPPPVAQSAFSYFAR